MESVREDKESLRCPHRGEKQAESKRTSASGKDFFKIRQPTFSLSFAGGVDFHHGTFPFAAASSFVVAVD
jgi:hypothetical protein